MSYTLSAFSISTSFDFPPMQQPNIPGKGQTTTRKFVYRVFATMIHPSAESRSALRAGSISNAFFSFQVATAGAVTAAQKSVCNRVISNNVASVRGPHSGPELLGGINIRTAIPPMVHTAGPENVNSNGNREENFQSRKGRRPGHCICVTRDG